MAYIKKKLYKVARCIKKKLTNLESRKLNLPKSD